MSFAADFSKGFQQGFSDAQQEKARKEEWKMKMDYQRQLDRDERMREQEKLDREATANAKTIAEATGNTDAVSLLKDRLRAGASYNAVYDYAKNNVISRSQASTPQVGNSSSPNDPNSKGSKGSTQAPQFRTQGGKDFAGGLRRRDEAQSLFGGQDQRQSQSISANSGQYTVTPKPEEPEDFKGDIDRVMRKRAQLAMNAATGGEKAKQNLQNFDTQVVQPFMQTQSILEGDRQKAPTTMTELGAAIGALEAKSNLSPEEQRLKQQYEKNYNTQLQLKASETGSDKSQYAVITNSNGEKQAGYVRREMQDGQLVPVDVDGNAIQGKVSPIPKRTTKLIDDVINQSTSKQANELVTDQSNSLTAFRIGRTLVDMVENDPNVLAQTTVSVASGLQDIMKEGKAAAEIFFGVSQDDLQDNPEGVILTADQMKQMEDSLEGTDFNRISNAADRGKFFNSRLMQLVYRAGRVEGQSGRAFTEKDAERIEGILTGANKPEPFKQALKSFLGSSAQEINDRADNMNIGLVGQKVNAIKRQLGGFSPVDEIYGTMDEYIQNVDPSDDLQQFYRESVQAAGRGFTTEQQDSIEEDTTSEDGRGGRLGSTEQQTTSTTPANPQEQASGQNEPTDNSISGQTSSGLQYRIIE